MEQTDSQTVVFSKFYSQWVAKTKIKPMLNEDNYHTAVPHTTKSHGHPCTCV